MPPHIEFDSARFRDEPIVYTFTPDDQYPEGRTFTFPGRGSMSGADWVTLIARIAEGEMTGGMIIRVIAGDDLWEDLVMRTNALELEAVVTDLRTQYGIDKPAGDQAKAGDGDVEGSAGST